MDQRHEMVLESTHSSGAEDWYCPICGRRMTITWHPWKKIVLEPGDMYAAHSARKGGLRLGPVNIRQGGEGDQPSVEDRYLAPWVQWLKNIDLDDLGKGQDQ